MPVGNLISGKPDVIGEGPFTPLNVLLCLFGSAFWLLLLLEVTDRITWSWLVVCAPLGAEALIALGWLAVQLIRIKRKKPDQHFPWLTDRGQHKGQRR